MLQKEDTPSEISHDVGPSLSVTPTIENTNHTEGKKLSSSGVGFADVDEQAEKMMILLIRLILQRVAIGF